MAKRLYSEKELEKNEIYTLCPTEEALLQWVIEGGWLSIEDFENSVACSRDELIGHWFFTAHDRIWIRE